MLLHARAKINWALNITGRRDDGYHLLDMVMQRIELCDDLSIEPADALSLSVDGTPAGGDNLVLRAADALRAAAGCARGARMALTKRIPAQAGLGGGSADCAAALIGLNALWELKLSDEKLAEIGLSLGADVPFCLACDVGRRSPLARVRGIGEAIDPISPAPDFPLVLIRPSQDGEPVGLSTGKVFRRWDDAHYPAVDLDAPALTDALTGRDLNAVDRLNANALTAPAVELLPGISDAVTALREAGAFAAFMTGSGSTVVGAFADLPVARAAANRHDATLTRCVAG